MFVCVQTRSYFGQTTVVLLFVFPEVLVQRILVHRETGNRPVERRHVHLVHVLGMRGGQRAQGAPVERAFERHYGQIRRARRHVDHARLLFQVSEV